MNPCGICGCEETTIRDEDHRDWEDYPHVDRYFMCVNCGIERGKATIKPYDDDWGGIIFYFEEEKENEKNG